ncbi:PH domain-containing protein [Geomicrobium sp. JCM 19038]|uniref:PH domain-containing protein n=1 Tax=Geomicrobium sp. JCM 19038 TaxID=1460635 RepID=UPI0005A85360|nr:PH domain-containing protein [Geomicrobium sp. JCM 19038]
MHTVESVKHRFKEVGISDTFGTKKEIKELPKILHDNEVVNYATSGFLEGNTWLVVSTNQRVIFIDKGMVYGIKQKEILLEKINSIAQKRGMVFGEIHIWDGADKFIIKQCMKATVQPFIDATNEAIKKVKGATINSTHEIELSNYAKIKELKELLDIGAISDEEFQTEKKKLLG